MDRVYISLSELGISWKNPELVSEAVSLGKKGNIVARYKAEKDLQNKGKNYPVVLDFDKEAIVRLWRSAAVNLMWKRSMRT